MRCIDELITSSRLIRYHQFGNLGIIAYVGGGVQPEGIVPAIEEACTFMGSDNAKGVTDVLLVGHWNDASSGCPTGSNTPSIRDVAASLPGCSQFGGRLRFADGHTHCNNVQVRATFDSFQFYVQFYFVQQVTVEKPKQKKNKNKNQKKWNTFQN